MSAEKKPNIEWPKLETTIFSVFSGTMLNEQDIRRLQRENHQEEKDQLEVTPKIEQSKTVWETKKALAIRTALTPAQKIKDKLKRAIFPDGYSVFINKSPKR